ncbi:hypothetical protein BY996DRAFT_4555304, partial [Phakopsora pachyrhizi]
ERVAERTVLKGKKIYTLAWKEGNNTQKALMSNLLTEINYLLLLHRESPKQENQLLFIKLYHNHQIEPASSAYEAEMQNALGNYSNEKNQAREKLLESLKEWKQKIKEERELIDFNRD